MASGDDDNDAKSPPRAVDFERHPCDLELIQAYLRPWVNSRRTAPPAVSCIHAENVYSEDPEKLTRRYAPAVARNGEHAWYFLSRLRTKANGICDFGARFARTVENGLGRWKIRPGQMAIVDVFDDHRRQFGRRRSLHLMYEKVEERGGKRVGTWTGWIMEELRLGIELGRSGRDVDLCALCKVYRSSHHPARPSDGAPAVEAVVAGPEEGDGSSANTASETQELGAGMIPLAAAFGRLRARGGRRGQRRQVCRAA